MLQKTNPDIVTVDSVMPGISGTELIQFINQNDSETGRKTTILMISSDDVAPEDRRKIKVDKYIVKPITMAKIKIALEGM